MFGNRAFQVKMVKDDNPDAPNAHTLEDMFANASVLAGYVGREVTKIVVTAIVANTAAKILIDRTKK